MMLDRLYGLARPMLFLLPPEDAHEATLKSLERGLFPRSAAGVRREIATTAFGLDFPNPLGIAAGFDKDARVPDAVLGMGCGFAEIGTVTPLPQPGNPKPRVFRLVADHGLVNRLGFNNGGHAAALVRLERRPRHGIVGVNIGANKDTEDRAADYVRGIETFNGVASYFTVNISSPNTRPASITACRAACAAPSCAALMATPASPSTSPPSRERGRKRGAGWASTSPTARGTYPSRSTTTGRTSPCGARTNT